MTLAHISPGQILPGTTLLLGTLLLVGVFAALLAKAMTAPRVVGYLLAGVAVKLALIASIEYIPGLSHLKPMVHHSTASLRPLKELAIGLILFFLGGCFDTARIRAMGGRIFKISLGESCASFLAVGIGCAVLGWLFLDFSLVQALTIGLLLGSIAVATAPAATLMVLQEYGAKGPNTDTLLTLVGINNIISIVLFHLAFIGLVIAGFVEAPHISEGRNLILDVLLTSIGSAVVGIALGVALALLHAKLALTETLVVFIAMLIAMAEACEFLNQQYHVSLNFLVASLFIGAAFSNLAIDAEKLYAAGQTLASPIYVAFFVIAGFELHLDELADLGVVGIGYVALRSIGKYMGARWAIQHVADRRGIESNIGLGLLCQAGVAIGLLTFLQSNWGTIGDQGFVRHEMVDLISVVILGAVAIFELFGPLMTKSVAVRSGEVKALALLRRSKAAAVEGRSVSLLILRSLAQKLGLVDIKQTRRSGPLCTEHIMRTNVRVIQAAATFDEVLHFVEQSRFNTFPTVDQEGHLIGVITFSEIRDLIYDPSMRELITAADLADASQPTAYVDQPLIDLLEEFEQTDLEALPVTDRLDSRKVVGIVEQRDLLQALHISVEDIHTLIKRQH